MSRATHRTGGGRPEAPRARRAALALAAALALVAAGCGGVAEPDLPPGAWLAGDSATLAPLLERAESLEGTRLAREAAALRERIADCEHFVAHAEGDDLEALPEAVRCQGHDALPNALAAVRGEAPLVFAGPVPGGARVAGVLRVTPEGSARLRARLLEAPNDGLAGLLLPGDAAPGRGVLAGAEALVHARVRSANGLDIAGLVPEESQGSQLFALKSDLFAGAVLDGTWELALYMPEPGRRMPHATVALGVRSERLGREAMERFLEQVRARWPLRPTAFAVREHEGACLPSLRLLPELAPCYVAARGALVAGWNAESVRRALAEGAERPEARKSGIALRLGRFGEADERLRQTLAPDAPPADLAYPWSRLDLRAARGDGGAIRLRGALEAREGAKLAGEP